MADPKKVVDSNSEVDKTEASDTEKPMIEHTHIKPQAEDNTETDHISTAEASVLLKTRTDASQSNEDGLQKEQEPAPEARGQETEQEPAPEARGQETEQEPAPEARGQEPEQEPAPEARGQEPEQEPAPEPQGQEPALEEQEQTSIEGHEPALEEQEQTSVEGQEPALEQENDLAVGNQEELLEKGEQGVSEPTTPLTEITEEISQITTETFTKLLAAEIYNLDRVQLEALESEMSVPEVMTNATATVKIMLVPDIQRITMAFNIDQTVGKLKQCFASQLKVPQDVLQVMFQGRLIEDSETLMDIGVRPQGTIQIEMFSLDPEQYPIKAIKLQQDYNMPDVITVRVQTDSDTFQDVAVEIERPTYRKPFLGGFKHRVTGVEFHNAGSQTVPKKRCDKGIKVFCRETQTIVEKNKRQQTRNTTSTQMTKIGLYVSNMTDKLIEPRTYLTAEEYHKQRLDAVIVLQTYFRRWHAINVVQKLREEKRLRLEWEAQEELRKKREKEERLRRERERRLNPKTKEDFELLYHALELWRQEEIERINSTLAGAERKAALCALLEQETQLIASIGRHKLNADEENQQKAILFFLDKCAEPKRWKAYDGKITEMDTQFTLRSRELLEIYRSISMKDLPKDERLDVLLTLKHTVKEHECKLTHEIVELIDREADLMMRGVKECNLEGLRKRICTLFLQYIKTPVFNPEVARVLKVPPDPLKLYKNIYFCRGCKSYLPSTEFSVPANSRTVGRCRRCCKLDNEARHREAFLKYKLMLKNLRKSEADYQDDAKIAYVVQQKDLQYMVENIWGCQSALSAWDDLHDLVMVRWDKHCEWSPWNTVLLSKDEAKAHLKLHNLQEAYEMVFIHRIKHKHILAKNYFSQIPEMASFLHKGDDQAHTNELLITKPIPAGSKA
ncbi:IQ and ubiquitin-like domain-containing protein isoform X1 [Mauremys mutica]|nr:IQ and ubiquitin-like domain-containing protein isoform X1 [Mauremys mutica]XP_044851485.1 IQ and ubiquitin-like domain-containing protein isoform X1 [Mauremys mutica]